MSTRPPTGKLLVKLVLAAVAMFAFAIFVMPPLYNLLCEITGIGGKTKGSYEAVDVRVDTSREVVVQFIAANNADMPWDFYPMQTRVTVHPGEPTNVEFFARNKTQSDMVGQAIPGVVPFNAADYFHKTECFCFNSQPLAAGEEAQLALTFIVDPDLPESINSLTLSYTLFDITSSVSNSVAQIQK
jgi:cytochrome c oxidase assembly protein subunit 11